MNCELRLASGKRGMTALALTHRSGFADLFGEPQRGDFKLAASLLAITVRSF